MFDAIKRFFRIGASSPSYQIGDARVWGLGGAFGAGYTNQAGVKVTNDSALTVSAWWRGVDLVSSAIAKMPYGVWKVHRRESREIDRAHEWHYPLSKKPARYHTAFTWRKLMTSWVISRGNAYAYTDHDNHWLTPLNPDWVTPVVERNQTTGKETLWYHYSWNGVYYNPDEILHYRGLSFDGLVGYGVLEMAAECLGLHIAARGHQSTSLANSGRPSVLLIFPKKLQDKQKKEIRDDWERMFSGSNNSRKTAVIDGEMTVKDFAFSAAELQLMETQRFTIKDISNFLGVPEHKLGSRDGAGYNSTEQENIAWTADTLEAITVNIEQEDEDKLLTEKQKAAGSHEMGFDRTKAAFESADLAAKANYLRTALGGHPWITPAEARRLDGKNWLDGTDLLPTPLNMGNAGGQNNEPNNPASDPPKRKSLQVATAAALDVGIRRVFKRLGEQARAADKRGELAAWLESVVAKSVSAVSSELASLESAAGLAHEVDLTGKIAPQILAHFKHAFHNHTVDEAISKLDQFTISISEA